MPIPDELRVRLAAWLTETIARSGLSGPAAAELRRDLESHVFEALARRTDHPTAADLEAVLAEMEPPEPLRAEAPARAVPRGEHRRWWYLALAALALNAAGLWYLGRGRSPRASPPPRIWVAQPAGDGVVTGQMAVVWRFDADVAGAAAGARAEGVVRIVPPLPGRAEWMGPRELRFQPDAAWPAASAWTVSLAELPMAADGRAFEPPPPLRVRTAPLMLLGVEQAGLSAARELTLRLRFNAPPDPAALRRHVEIRGSDGNMVDFAPVGEVASAEVLLRTGTLAADRVSVRVRAGLPPATGQLSLQETVEQEIAVSARPRLSRLRAQIEPHGPARLLANFTAEITAGSAAAHISIEPPVRFAVEPFDSWEGAGLRIVGDFRPGAVYTVTFGAGLTTPDGVALGAPEVRRVQVPHRPAAIEFSAGGRYLAPAGPLPIRLTAVNLTSCRLEARPLLRPNLVYFALREEGRLQGSYTWNVGVAADSLTGPATNLTLRFPDVRDEPQEVVADLRDLAGAGARGAWLLTATARDLPAAHHLVVVTDLGLTVKRTRDGALVWVTSLTGATPVAGATVTLYGRNSAELGRGVTDPDGVAMLTFPTPPPEAEPFLVTAESAGDLSFLRLPGSEVRPEAEIDGRPYLREGIEAYVFADRGIYRPGETARVHAVVRNSHGEPPEPFPVALQVVLPDGRPLRRLNAMLDALGAADFAVALPDHLPTGVYGMRLQVPGADEAIGACSLALEDFVPPRVECAVELPEGRLLAGSAVSIRARARHMFGRAAEGLVAEASLMVEPAAFSPGGYEGWIFGDPGRQFSPVRLSLGRRTLDADGRAEWSAATGRDWRPPAALRAVATVTVIEAGGRPLSAVASVPLDPVPEYIGLRPARAGGHLAPGEPLRLEVALVAPDGTARARDETLRATVAREEWAHAMRRDASGVWSWRSERVLTTVAEFPVALTAGQGVCEIRLDRPGAHVVSLASAAGAASSLRLLVAAPASSPVERSRERPDVVELEPDRSAGSPGDRIRIAVRAPFAGLALVTLESDTVLDRRVIPIGDSVHLLEYELREEYAPTVYAVVTMVRPARPEAVWSARRAIGAVALDVVPRDRRLGVDIRTPEETRPGTVMTVDLGVRDEHDRPAPGAAVVVAAVDEAVLRLTDFTTPDPWAFFHGRRKLAVNLFDLFSELVPLLAESTAAPSHPAGGESATLRRRLSPVRSSRFRPLALRADVVRTDSNGTARVAFQLPEFAGRLRVFAVAYDYRRCGAAERAVTVRRPLVVQTSLPRFLAPGDRCAMAVHLYNETDRPRSAQVRVMSRGPLQVEDEDRTVPLEPKGRATLEIPVVAARSPGVALCSVEVVAEEERIVEALELPVRPAVPRHSLSFAGVLAGGESARIEPPADWLPNSLEAGLWFGAQPSLRFSAALDELLRYPYGCLEQTVSAAWPWLALPDLERAADAGALPSARSAAEIVAAAIERVLSMQTADGAFREWPDSPRLANWSGVYAVHFLLEARRAGHLVPADRLDVALDRLRARLDAGGPVDATPSNPAWQDHQEIRAYILELLALAGRPEASWTARLLELAHSLRPSTRAHLAAALALGGRPRDALTLLRTVEPPAGIERSAIRRVGGCLNSRVRDAALLLGAWTRLAPDAAEAAAWARRLTDAADQGRWATTLENASALVALGRWIAAQPAPTEGLNAELYSGGSLVARTESADQPVRWSSSDPAAVRQLRLQNHGPARCHYGGRLSGVPARLAETSEDDRGLIVRRRWLRPDGTPWPGGPLRQGDALVVRIELAVDPALAPLENVVVEDLLPAGLEIEDAALETARRLPWLGERRNWLASREARDDRMLLFSEPLTAPPGSPATWHYAVRAVTPGRYVVPPIRAEAMYDPAIRSMHGGGELEVLR
ncbi:MAG: MG2 domain-containing protein [Kiritimatiellae bacterium]|nr:MG2 domain-containing protein [Kiritimatiellia bacterium]